MGITETSPELIPVFDLRITPEDLEAVATTLRSGWLTMGPRTQAFEQAFAEKLGAPHVVAVSSCTAALHLAYLAAGIGPGDEVIVPSCTMVATAAAVLYTGGTPVFADIIGPGEPLIDPSHVEVLITPRTKAVVAMHYAGYGAAVDRLAALCEERGLILLEDAAHSPLASVRGRTLGTWGLAGAFSFFSNKVLAVGEGGALATADERVAKLARSRRGHAMTTVSWDRHQGNKERYDVDALGFNYRIDDVRAALLLSRLPRLEAEIERRRALTHRYRGLLAQFPGLIVPFSDAVVATSSCHLMPIVTADDGVRDRLKVALREHHRIQTTISFPSVHRFTAYRERFPDVSLPHTERFARGQLTLPLYSHMTEGQQDRVIEALAAELGA